LASALLTVAAATSLRVEDHVLSAGWSITGERTTGTVEFTVAIKQQNLDKLASIALAVSDPSSPSYTNYLTNDEIATMAAPSNADVAAVTGWLNAYQLNYTMTSKHTIEVTAPVASAEKLLNTTWRKLSNAETKQSVHRAGAYTIPAQVAGSVDAMFSVHGLPLPPRVHKVSGEPAVVTPAVIGTTYGISGVTPSGSAANNQAVAEFQGQFMIPANLVAFFKKFVPSAPAADAVVSKFGGDPNGAQEGIEADLDIQYIMGVAPGIKTEFWEQKSSDFCKDLQAWTTLLLADPTCPKVNSVSYGWQGDMSQLGCEATEWKAVDANFMKLATMGITVLFASGDSGSGYTGSTLWPSWPASSAWVTSVGGTRFQNQQPGQPEQATDQFGSGGGYSSMVDRSQAAWQEAVVSAYLKGSAPMPPSSAYTATGRATPDVAGLAEGYQVFTGPGQVQSVGGTSASTPMFGAVVSLLNEARMAKGMKSMGFMNPFVYANPTAFNDITVGSNKVGRGGQPLPAGWECTTGWDPVTGLGTPKFSALLAAATGGSPPGPPSPPSPGPPGPSPSGCAAISPANRTDCGFTKTATECAAAGCCYDDTNPLSYRCFNNDVCAAIDPAKRVDCGYQLSQQQCVAKGCCYDKSVPYTFSCFDKTGPAPGPPPPGPPPPPSPGPPPPPPPSPGPPSGAPYGDPAKGPCNAGEKAVQINGINGKYCAPSCSTSSPCPAVPAPATAAAQCVVSDPNPPPSLCAVICVPGADFLKSGDGGCMTGASCQAIQGTGVCTYPDSSPTTFAFNLDISL